MDQVQGCQKSHICPVDRPKCNHQHALVAIWALFLLVSLGAMVLRGGMRDDPEVSLLALTVISEGVATGFAGLAALSLGLSMVVGRYSGPLVVTLKTIGMTVAGLACLLSFMGLNYALAGPDSPYRTTLFVPRYVTEEEVLSIRDTKPAYGRARLALQWRDTTSPGEPNAPTVPEGCEDYLGIFIRAEQGGWYYIASDLYSDSWQVIAHVSEAGEWMTLWRADAPRPAVLDSKNVLMLDELCPGEQRGQPSNSECKE